MHSGNGLPKLPAGMAGVPIIGARVELPEAVTALALKPGERLIVTLPGDTDPKAVHGLAMTLIQSGVERPIIVADWAGLSCVEPDVAQLVERILALRSMVQKLRDDTEGARGVLDGDPLHADLDAAAGAFVTRLDAILMTDATNPS